MQKATATSAVNAHIVRLLDPLPIDLEPAALLERLIQLHHKGTDNDTLGHVYYTRFYGNPKTVAPVATPSSSSLLSLYTTKHTTTKQSAKSAPSAVNVDVVQLTHPTVYVASICDEVNSYVMRGGIIPAQVFCQVIRYIHPHEIRGTYYHNTEICGGTFNSRDVATKSEPYLTMVNIRLREYFSSGRSLDDVLIGMKKCLCLRMLSNNMYYYRDHPDALYPAIQRLMQFYTLSGFLHLSSQEVFDSHYNMILKYNQLMSLVKEVCIKPEFHKFLHGNRCSFYKITQVESTFFEVAVCDDDSGTIYTLHLNTLPALLRHIRPIPPHKVQSHFLNPRTAFVTGPARSPTRKRSRSPSHSHSIKRRRGHGGARSNKSAKKFTKTRKIQI